jgi:AcrR family transcriptional regulator
LNLKKQSILAAATSLFSKNGYHAVGVDSIVAKSNVAKMTFYKHYPSKEFLIESVLIQRDIDLRQSIEAALEKRRTPKTKLKGIFDWYEEWFSTEEFHGCMFIKASEEFPEIGVKIRDISQTHKEWVESLISGLLKECDIKSHKDLAVHILTMLDGLTVRSNLFKEGAENHVKSAWRYVGIIIDAESRGH